MTVLTTHEQQEIDRANAAGKQPVVFVHGLWLLSQQLGQLACTVRRAGLHDARAGLAR